MRRTVRLVLVGALAFGAVAGFVPAASANAAGDLIQGGCGFITDDVGTLNGGNIEGVIYDASATLGPTGVPTGATVECWVAVNGVKQDSTDLVATGFGVQANAKQISFATSAGDIIEEIQCVTYADGTTEPCTGPCTCDAQIPPQGVIDLYDAVSADVNRDKDAVVDPVVCPLLVKLAGSYGPVTIAPDGDVYVPDPLDLFGGPVYDCPPYSPVTL